MALSMDVKYLKFILQGKYGPQSCQKREMHPMVIKISLFVRATFKKLIKVV
jgi:hypothetical protein